MTRWELCDRARRTLGELRQRARPTMGCPPAASEAVQGTGGIPPLQRRFCSWLRCLPHAWARTGRIPVQAPAARRAYLGRSHASCCSLHGCAAVVLQSARAEGWHARVWMRAAGLDLVCRHTRAVQQSRARQCPRTGESSSAAWPPAQRRWGLPQPMGHNQPTGRACELCGPARCSSSPLAVSPQQQQHTARASRHLRLASGAADAGAETHQTHYRRPTL